MQPTNQFIIFLNAEQPLSAQIVGGKTAGLAALTRAGYPVPPGFCLTTEAFKLALRPFQSTISSLIQTPTLTHAQTASQISDLLQKLTLPAYVRTELIDSLQQINAIETAVAVRSSSSDEDGPTSSFAGQYATILGVQGEKEIEHAVIACWRSYFSAHALAHRAQIDSNRINTGMAVLLQPLFDVECAGLAFSVDPVGHTREQIVVNSAWGLGVGIVDGTISNDTDWVERTNWQIEKRHIPEKLTQIKLNKAGQLQKSAVPKGNGRSACLPDIWLKRIAQFAVTAEQLFSHPQDVEWAIANQQIWILQSRPLTALPPELSNHEPFPVSWQNNDQTFFWQRTHFKAYRQDVPLPLEYNQFEIQESIREETCRLMGVERNTVMKKFNGRPYYREVAINWTEADRRVSNQALEDQRDRLFEEGRTLWDVWGPEIVKATERLRAFDYSKAGGLTLAENLEAAQAVFRRHTSIHPLCSWRPRQAYYAAYAAVTGQSGSEAEAAAIQLLDGEDTPLTHLIDMLYILGQTAIKNPVLTGFLKEPPAGSSDDLVQQLDDLGADTAVADFKQQVLKILAAYAERMGDGYGSEATICTPTWHERPSQFLRLAAIYLDPAQESPKIMRARKQKERMETVAAICATCDDEPSVANFKRLWHNGRRWWTVLEVHNHYIDQMTLGLLRRAIMASARWLAAKGCLQKNDDIFWLQFTEIDAALRTENPKEYTATIETRQAQHTAWSKLSAPSILGLPAANLPTRPASSDEVTENGTAVDPDIVSGQGASAGQVTGRACVAIDTWTWPNVTSGDILVAKNIGPRWTPLFPLLGGIVLDSGSVGQHAAATAREYGVTAVIGTGNATRRIQDGDIIEVDGIKGIVKILSQNSEQHFQTTEHK